MLVVVTIAFGCGSKKDGAQEAPIAGSASGSAAGSGRPSIVTSEMAETFELYVVAFEKLTADIEHAGNDCKAMLALVQRDTKEQIAPLAPRGEKLGEAMKAAKGDRAAGEWFAATYAPRMKASSARLKPLETVCAQDAELHAALDEAMSQFPMMRRKK
ncbi:MAG: hypothetical protein ABI467_21885 [Kofleriaceae bacterium]